MGGNSELLIGDGAQVAAIQHGVDCRVGSLALVGDRCELGNRVEIGPRATVLAPDVGTLQIGDDASVGASAVIAGAENIGIGVRIAPGAIVTQDVPPFAIVSGNPAKVIGYSAPSGSESSPTESGPIEPPERPGAKKLIADTALITFPEVVDLRGALTFGEIGGLLPFQVNRFFVVFDVPSEAIRGEHAHREVHQLLICIHGKVRVSLTDGSSRQDVVLERPSVGLHLPPMVWATQFGYSPEARLLVLCSGPYDPTEYVRDYNEFLGSRQ